ncbi:MAG: helix-turn-helix transcriptional regulator [Halobacteriaceae archaeon]
MPSTEHERPADELVSLLARRIEVLEALLDQPRTRPELVETLDISRSTVDRAVRELEGMALVEYEDDLYRASLAGRLAHREYAELREELVVLEEATELLAVLPPDAPLDLTVLQGGNVVLAREPAPHVPGTQLANLLEGADEVRSLSMAYTTPETGEVLAEGVRSGGTEASLVFERGLYEYLLDSDALDIETLLADPDFEGAVTEGLPFGLVIARTDDTREVCIAVYDADRALRGIIRNDTPAALEWAESIWTQYWETATLVE